MVVTMLTKLLVFLGLMKEQVPCKCNINGVIGLPSKKK